MWSKSSPSCFGALRSRSELSRSCERLGDNNKLWSTHDGLTGSYESIASVQKDSSTLGFSIAMSVTKSMLADTRTSVQILVQTTKGLV